MFSSIYIIIEKIIAISQIFWNIIKYCDDVNRRNMKDDDRVSEWVRADWKKIITFRFRHKVFRRSLHVRRECCSHDDWRGEKEETEASCIFSSRDSFSHDFLWENTTFRRLCEFHVNFLCHLIIFHMISSTYAINQSDKLDENWGFSRTRGKTDGKFNCHSERESFPPTQRDRFLHYFLSNFPEFSLGSRLAFLIVFSPISINFLSHHAFSHFSEIEISLPLLKHRQFFSREFSSKFSQPLRMKSL